MSYEKELDTALLAVQRAADSMMVTYHQDNIAFTSKTADCSPVTQADLESNAIICQTLQANFSYPILSEENKDDLARLQAKRVWVVDPLDGTKEFLAKNGEFTINIALVEHNRPILGVIACPDKNIIFFAAAGCGAKQLENGKEKTLTITEKTTDVGCKLAISRSHLAPELKQNLQNLNNCQLISCGSALKYCMVANSSIDASLRKTPLYEWDIAAADCILQEASGMMTNFAGNTFFYNQKNPLIDTGIIASNKQFYSMLLKLVQ